MMSLFAGIALLACSVLFYLVLRWGVRRPQEPAWAKETWMSMVHVPLLVGMLAFGVAFTIQFVAGLTA